MESYPNSNSLWIYLYTQNEEENYKLENLMVLASEISAIGPRMEKSLMLFWCCWDLWDSADNNGFGEQPLSKIATLALNDSSSINAYPSLLGLKVKNFIHYMAQCYWNLILFLAHS